MVKTGAGTPSDNNGCVSPKSVINNMIKGSQSGRDYDAIGGRYKYNSYYSSNMKNALSLKLSASGMKDLVENKEGVRKGTKVFTPIEITI